jgi:prophage antirepressor-like protein
MPTRLPPLEQRPWYTLEEACAMLGYTAKTGHNLIHLETFPVPHFKMGRRVMVMKDVVAHYFEQKKAEGIDELQRRAKTFRTSSR